jgi:hypothetical protein
MDQCLIFCRTNYDCDNLERFLNSLGELAGQPWHGLHGVPGAEALRSRNGALPRGREGCRLPGMLWQFLLAPHPPSPPTPQCARWLPGGGSGAGWRGKRESGRESPYSCVVLAGARSMDERRAALQAFKDGDVRFLICTDVAARGLDIQVTRFFWGGGGSS